jgi:hypothetical protein
LKELVDAKINHLLVPQDNAEQQRRGNVVNLMDALRKSLGSAAAPVGRSTKKSAASVRPEPKKGIGSRQIIGEAWSKAKVCLASRESEEGTSNFCRIHKTLHVTPAMLLRLVGAAGYKAEPF